MAAGECDVAVVGAGIVGLAVARELRRRHDGLAVTVFEREPRVAAHQTGRSSGVIHAGIYYAPGSLKARLCVEGARELYAYCAEHDIAAERRGKVIVAAGHRELPALDELERRGRENGVPGLRRLDSDGLREIEPHVRGLAALHSPATGVVDFAAVARALAREAGDVRLGCAVQAIEPGLVRHADGRTRARLTIACAGAWASRLAVAAGAPAEPRIVPFRGAYLRLRPPADALVRGLVYPVPDPELPFLGAHLTRDHRGDVLVGPTALLWPRADSLSWPGTWRVARRFWRTGLREVRHAASRAALVREARRYVPELRTAHTERWGAGIRAQAVDRDGRLVDDFVVSRTEGAFHVRNAPSPAATAALALARLIADEAAPDLAG